MYLVSWLFFPKSVSMTHFNAELIIYCRENMRVRVSNFLCTSRYVQQWIILIKVKNIDLLNIYGVDNLECISYSACRSFIFQIFTRHGKLIDYCYLRFRLCIILSAVTQCRSSRRGEREGERNRASSARRENRATWKREFAIILVSVTMDLRWCQITSRMTFSTSPIKNLSRRDRETSSKTRFLTR